MISSVGRLAREWVFITGAMSSGERYVPRHYYHPRNAIEVCPQHSWILLLAKCLEWTGKAHYAAEIERDLFTSVPLLSIREPPEIEGGMAPRNSG